MKAVYIHINADSVLPSFLGYGIKWLYTRMNSLGLVAFDEKGKCRKIRLFT